MMTLTLRAKVLAALLLSSLGAVLVVALVTPWLMEHRFLGQARSAHFDHFTHLIERYQQMPGALPWGNRDAALDLYHRIIEVDKARHSQRQARRPAGRRPLPGFPPPPGFGPPGRQQGAPFASQDMRFVLADTEGYVFHPFFDYQAGQKLTWLERLRADELTLNGQPVGYALAAGTAPETRLDDSYRTLLYQSLAVAGGVALVLSFLVAFFLTRPMLRQLRHLSNAVHGMEPGNRSEPITVSGRDEIATLAHAFNRMSDELTDKYQALQSSNATIARQAQTLEKLSYTDELTGLYNRRYFNEQFDHWFGECRREGRQLALIIIDVDHFKRINDNFSHQTGDAVLQQIARLLRECVRSHDILARFGGEELILLMPDTSLEKAEEIAERMRRHIEEHSWHQIAVGLQVTASFGLTSLQTTQHDMLRIADEQLYRAKDGGRNSVCVA